MGSSLRHVGRPGRALIPIIQASLRRTVLETTDSALAADDPTAVAMQRVDGVIRERLSSRVALIDPCATRGGTGFACGNKPPAAIEHPFDVSGNTWYGKV